MSCRPERLVPELPGPFRPLAVPRPVVVVKRKHGDRRVRWEWDGDLVGMAGRGWRVVGHVRGIHERRLVAASSAEPQTAVELRWLGTRAPATILVKLDDDLRVAEVKVDAALPVPRRGDRLLFTDLDVDVVRDRSGTVTVRDWDAFDARGPVRGYTEATRAVAAAGEAFGRRLLEAWEATLERDIAAIVATTGTAALASAGPAAGAGGSPRLRRAGRLHAGGGETVIWSVAEGRRGRRWRSLRLDPAGRVASDLLLEVDPAGRWTRLEIASAAGILTLHPEPDDSAVHGNVVTPGGMRHLALGWGRGHRLVVEGEPIADAALGAASPAGAGPGLVVAPDLAVEERPHIVAPAADAAGLLPDSWPLEEGAP